VDIVEPDKLGMKSVWCLCVLAVTALAAACSPASSPTVTSRPGGSSPMLRVQVAQEGNAVRRVRSRPTSCAGIIPVRRSAPSSSHGTTRATLQRGLPAGLSTEALAKVGSTL
jgi:hypothetical protein